VQKSAVGDVVLLFNVRLLKCCAHFNLKKNVKVTFVQGVGTTETEANAVYF